jgi:hypothetical protein
MNMEWAAAEAAFAGERQRSTTDCSREFDSAKAKLQETTALIAEMQNRQSRLLIEEAIESAYAVIAAASEIVGNRALATSDAFLRFHLLASAREIAAMPIALDRIMRGEASPPCLIRFLEREIARLKTLFPERVGRMDCSAVAVDLIPSWSSACIFGLIARILLEDAVRQTPKAWLSVWLNRDEEILRFGIDGAGKCGEAALMQRISSPGRCRALVSSLSGRIEAAGNGISVRIPVIAITCLDETEISARRTVRRQ